jgi:predicted ATPase
LFFDEPETSVNPELISSLVDILLELSRLGSQVFIATHSEVLASYININRNNEDHVMFYSLVKDVNGQVIAYSNDRFDKLEPNKLSEEPVKIYELELDRRMGND